MRKLKKLLSALIVFAMVISAFPAPHVSAEGIVGANIKLGDYIKLGTYKGEDIVWRCIDIDANGALMLSDRILINMAFDGAYGAATGTADYPVIQGEELDDNRKKSGSNNWEFSNVRQWLNSDEETISWWGAPPSSGNVNTNPQIGYYDSEHGFLTNFTLTERTAVKTVAQKSILSEIDKSMRVGGIKSDYTFTGFPTTGITDANYNDAYYKTITDRMFLLDVMQYREIFNNALYYPDAPTTRYSHAYPTEWLAANRPSTIFGNTATRANYFTRTPVGPSSHQLYFQDASHELKTVSAFFGNQGIRPAFYLNELSEFSGGAGAFADPYHTVSSGELATTLDVQGFWANHGQIEANVRITSAKESITAIVAVYENGGDSFKQIADVKTEKFTITAGVGGGTITVDNVPEGTYDVKIYVWENMENIIPELPGYERNNVFVADTTYGIDALNGEGDITVVAIGGSLIDEGDITAPLFEHLREMFPDRNLNCIKAGVPGTGSELQAFRVENDVLRHNPDIVFIDATVNDALKPNPSQSNVTYEAVIRKLMNHEHQPVVIRLNLGYHDLLGWQAADNAHAPVADYYGIGSVNVAQYIGGNIASAENPDGPFVWRAADQSTYPSTKVITRDGTHTRDADGGAIYAQFIADQINENRSAYFKRMTSRETPYDVRALDWANARMIPWNTEDAVYAPQSAWNRDYVANDNDGTYWGKLPDGYIGVSAETDGATVTLEFEGVAVGIYGIGGGNQKRIRYRIDGGETDSFSPGLLNISYDVFPSLVAEGRHTVVMELYNNDDNFPKPYKFGYFLVR